MFSALNDSVLCILYSCEDGLCSDRLPYYVYLWQDFGFDFHFRYKVFFNKIQSRAVDDYIDELINYGYIENKDGVIYLTEYGKKTLNNLIFTAAESRYLNALTSGLRKLTKEELVFLTMTSITIKEIIQKYGYEGLVLSNNYVENTLTNLTGSYSRENLNKSIKFIKLFKRSV